MAGRSEIPAFLPETPPHTSPENIKRVQTLRKVEASLVKQPFEALKEFEKCLMVLGYK